jgi:predicted ATPase
VAAALAEHRLVTLTGPGGVGKTRLAIEVATRTAARFPDGAHFVDLAAIRDSTLLPDAVAESLGIKREAGESAEAAIGAALASRRTLLVLDNLEQIPDGAASIARLLAAAADLHVLATSRGPLWIRGELEITIDPLPLPDVSPAAADAFASNPAVALFLDHATHHGPISSSAANRDIVVDICRRLDGLPLAIELAAARTRGLSLDAVQAQLARRLDLRGPQVDLPDRQRTLRDTIGWSADMLSPQAATLFRRLGVFVGGAPLAGAEAIAPTSETTIDALDELARHSLVRSGERYTMLETIREFAAEALTASGEGDEVRGRAVAWLTGVLDQAETRFARADDQQAAIASADAERANVRELLAWAAETGREEAGLLLAAHRHFWAMHGSVAEGRGWLERLLGLPVDYPDATVAQGRTVLASMLLRVGDLDGARANWEAASRLWEALGETRKVAVVENNLGIVAERQDDLDRATAHGVRALEQMRLLGDDIGVAATLGNLGVLALRQGDLDAGWQYNEEALALGRRTGNVAFTSIALTNLSGIAVKRGQPELARPWLEEALGMARELDDIEGMITVFETLGELALVRGEPFRAIRLYGGVDRLREEAEAVPSAWEQAQADAVLARCREGAGETAFEREWSAGRALDISELAAEALAS